jgi:WD40 repeat protein
MNSPLSIVLTPAPSEVRLWNAELTREITRLSGLGELPLSTCFSPDGNLLVAASWEGLRVWHSPSMAEINAAEAKENTRSRRP